MKKRRVISLVVLALLLVLLVPVVLVLNAQAVSTGLAENVVRSATGVDATLESFEVDLFPPKVRGRGMELPSAGAGMEDPAMTVKSFVFSLDPGRWWSDEATWWSGTASGVVVRMARNEDGRTNWPFDQPQDPPDSEPDQEQSWAYRFSSVDVSDMDFHRVTPDGTQHLAVQQLEMTKDADERVQFSLDGTWRGQPMSATGSVPLPRSERTRQIKVNARSSGTVVNVQGTVGHDGLVPGQAAFNVKASDLALFSMILDTDLSALAPLSLDGELAAPAPGRWELSASGEVGNQPVELAAELESASFNDEDASNDVLDLGRMSLDLGENAIEANGQVNASEHTATLNVESGFLDINQMQALVGAGQEPASEMNKEAFAFAGPWQMDVAVSIGELVYRQYRVRQLDGDFQTGPGELQADAKLARLASMADDDEVDDDVDDDGDEAGDEDVGGDGEAGAEAISEKSAASQWAVTDLQVDATLRVLSTDASAVSGQASTASQRQLTASVSAPGIDANIDASLAAEDLRLISGTIDAQVEDLSAVSGISLETEDPLWRNLMPFSLNLTARPEGGGWELEPFRMAGGGNDLEGSLTVDPTRQPLHIGGQLEAGLIDFNRIRAISPKPGNENGADDGDDDGDVFSTRPIDWSWLEDAALDIDLGIGELQVNQTVFRDVTVPFNLSEGVLRIDPLSARLSEGSVQGHMVAERSEEDARLDTELTVTNLKPADLGMEDEGMIDGGNTDLLLKLRSRGESPQALASNLTGEIALEVHNATIRNDVFEVIGSDLLIQTAELINPFSQQDETTELECAAAYFVADDGVLRSVDTLVIETSKMKIRGSGELNLHKEKVRIDFSPSARGGIGVSLGDLSSVVRIGGTLSDLDVEPDPSGVAKAGATIGAAVATGGLSLLAKGLFDRARNAGGTACGKIFEKAAAPGVPDEISPSM